MGSNDIVYLMAQDLKDLCDLTIIDTDIYGGNRASWFVNDYSFSKKRPVRWLNEEKVLDLVAQHHPDFVIVNSGGLSLKPQTITALKNKNVKTVGISLSDPDVFPENGKIYAEYYDLFYTNSKFALTNLYSPPTNIIFYLLLLHPDCTAHCQRLKKATISWLLDTQDLNA
jgi:hypothetical protein